MQGKLNQIQYNINLNIRNSIQIVPYNEILGVILYVQATVIVMRKNFSLSENGDRWEEPCSPLPPSTPVQ